MLSINHSEIKIQCINVNGGRLNYIFIIIKFCKNMNIMNNAKDSENKKMFRQVILICRPLLTKGKKKYWSLLNNRTFHLPDLCRI